MITVIPFSENIFNKDAIYDGHFFINNKGQIDLRPKESKKCFQQDKDLLAVNEALQKIADDFIHFKISYETFNKLAQDNKLSTFQVAVQRLNNHFEKGNT